MPRPSPIRTWLQLVRAPNLLTVPGDPLAGYLLACFGAVEAGFWPALGASLCFYAGGLLLNDLADLREDRAERPSRPLPSGAASASTVGIVMTVLFALGLFLCWQIEGVTLLTGLVMIAAIASYNLFTKRLPVIGALNMGACRGLSMLLGATAVTHGDLTYRLIGANRLNHLLVAVALLAGYIAAVTNLARFETKQEVPLSAKWLPVVMLLAGAMGFISYLTPTARTGTVALFALALISALQIALQLTREPDLPVPPQIGQFIRLLLVIQAALCAALGGVESSIAAGCLILLWPLSRLLGRWFYAS